MEDDDPSRPAQWVFTRAENGWIVQSQDGMTVHEGGYAEALLDALWEHFIDAFQSKYDAGIVARIGRSREEEEALVDAALKAVAGTPAEAAVRKALGE